jgi:hypothetical protein
MEDLDIDGLTIKAAASVGDEASLTFTWRGKSRSRKPTADLGPYLSRGIAAAKERGVPMVMRFDEIEYFNSGTVMAIVQTIHRARAEGVRLKVIYADALEWQKLSFEPLRVFAKGGTFELVPRGAGPS